MKEQEQVSESRADEESLELSEERRKPYEAPRLSSGDVFEKIVVASGPLEGEFVC